MAKLFQRQTALIVTQTGVTRQLRYNAVFTFKGDTPFILRVLENYKRSTCLDKQKSTSTFFFSGIHSLTKEYFGNWTGNLFEN